MTQNNRSIDIPELDDSRAVSPVIGVILMVAITIILAAVIGAFVLGFGADTETAPTASFSADQDADPFDDDGDLDVTFSHEGGSSVDAGNLFVTLPDTDDYDRVAVTELASPEYESGDSIRAGDAITADLSDDGDFENANVDNLEDGDRVQLVWESGDTSSVLRTYNINVDGNNPPGPA